MPDACVSEVERMPRRCKRAYLVKCRAGNTRQLRNLSPVATIVRHCLQIHGQVAVGISPISRSFVAHTIRCKQFQAVGHVLGGILQDHFGFLRIILGHGERTQHHTGVAHYIPIRFPLRPTSRTSLFVFTQHTVDGIFIDTCLD